MGDQKNSIHSYLNHWAEKTPDKPAIIQHENGQTTTYKEFLYMVDLYALYLVKLGIQKGERVAVMGEQSTEYVILQYACFKLGIIICPIDIRLKEREAVRNLNKITPAMFILMSTFEPNCFADVCKAVADNCDIKYKFVFSLRAHASFPGFEILNGRLDKAELEKISADADCVKRRDELYDSLTMSDSALIIFTTGTTGEPKPAVIHNECMFASMKIFLKASGMPPEELVRLCMLPCSHVGGTTITVYPTFIGGGTNVLMHKFHPVVALEAIEKRRCNYLAAVPTMFRMIWSVEDYEKYDISSLRCVYYAGSSVDKGFLEEFSKMAPNFGTSLGMTESGGVATYTPMPVTVDELYGQVGKMAEDVAKITIREPMNADGTAGAEKAFGEAGEICYHPPLVFEKYFDNTDISKIVSSEGILYTGDTGCMKHMDGYDCICYLARSKFIIKQKGYNVFPDEVGEHIAKMYKVSAAVIVGVNHPVYDEAIFAFVVPEKGGDVSCAEVKEHCKMLAAYKRPLYVEIWKGDLPLNINGKVDLAYLAELGNKIAGELRIEGHE